MKTILGLSALALVVLFGLVGCIVDIARDGPASPEPGVTSIGSFAAPSLGITYDADLKIVDVAADSLAQQAGIQIGDRIVKIRNVTITSARQARDTFRKGGYNQPIPFEVERSGQTITLEVVFTAGAPRPNNPNPSGPIPTPTAVPPDLFYF